LRQRCAVEVYFSLGEFFSSAGSSDEEKDMRGLSSGRKVLVAAAEIRQASVRRNGRRIVGTTSDHGGKGQEKKKSLETEQKKEESNWLEKPPLK